MPQKEPRTLDDVRLELALLQLDRIKEPKSGGSGFLAFITSPFGLSITGAITAAILAVLNNHLQGAQTGSDGAHG